MYECFADNKCRWESAYPTSVIEHLHYLQQIDLNVTTRNTSEITINTM